MSTGRSRDSEPKPSSGDRTVESDTARLVLAAAKRLFLEKGFDSVNLEIVGRAAGVTRQTIYNLFGSKEAMFRSMVEMHWATIAKDSEAVLAVGLDTDRKPSDLLRRFGEAIVRFVVETEQIAFTRLVVSESHDRPWVAEEFYRLGKQPLLDGFVECLKRLDTAGSIECRRPVVAAHQFFGMIQEIVIWPHVMAIGPGLAGLPDAEEAIEEAVLTFLGRYSSRSSDSSGLPLRRS